MIAKKLSTIFLALLAIALASVSLSEYFIFSPQLSNLREKCQRQHEIIKRYQEIVEKINSRTPLAQENLTRLIRVTPKIKRLALSLYSGNLLKDVEKYTIWVHKNIRYNYDSEYPYIIAGKVYFKPDVWAPSNVTLSRGYGDCEDLSILLASLIRAAYPKEDVYIIVISLGNVSHAAVLIPGIKGIADPTYGGVFFGKNFLFSWMSAISAPENSYVRFIVGFQKGKPYYCMFSSNSSFLSWFKEEYGA